MPVILRAVIIVVSLVGTGVAVGSIFTAMASETKEVMPPFFMISLAILIASIGYAIGNLRKSK